MLQILLLPSQILIASKLLLVNAVWTSKVILECSMHLIFKEKILDISFLTRAGNEINVFNCLCKLKTFLVWLCWLSFWVINFSVFCWQCHCVTSKNPHVAKIYLKWPVISYTLHIIILHVHGSKTLTLKKSLCLWIWI